MICSWNKEKSMELKDSKLGEVVNFTYRQPVSGTARRFLAKVMEIKGLSPEEIKRMDGVSEYRRSDPEFKRTPTLITCSLPGGHVRNFYAERTESCVKPIMGKISYTIQDIIARRMGW
jgi:hypothetical protein